MSNDTKASNKHEEERWTVEAYTGFDGKEVPPTECFKTVDETRTDLGGPYLNGCDGGMWFKVIRVESRHWWHHSEPVDPGFKVSYELEIGASSYGIGFHTTIPLISEQGVAALQGALDILKKDKAEQTAAGKQITDYTG